MRFLHILVCLVAVVAVGCSKSDSGGKSGAAGGGGGEMVELSLPKVGLKVTAPKGSKVEELMGSPAVKFPNSGMITLNKPTVIQEAKLEAAIKDTKESYAGSKDFHSEKLPNGWIYRYNHKPPIGMTYSVQARLTFGSKVWMCSTTASTADQQMAAYNACKSLKQ